jgi:hypothetical protein
MTKLSNDAEFIPNNSIYNNTQDMHNLPFKNEKKWVYRQN